MYELEEWDPFRHMKKAQRKMFDLFNLPELRMEKGLREPLIDILDKGNALEITAELPGVEKKDVKINITEDSLAINAESKSEVEEKQEKKGYYYHERSYNSFSRSIPLPTDVIAEKTKADFKNGVLTLTIPKKHPAEKKPKGFEIKIE